MVERNDRHILHKVFIDVIPEEVQRNVLRDALEKAGANIEAARPERRHAKTEALERWFDQFQREIPVRVGGSVSNLREYLLKHFPTAIMSDLGRDDVRTVRRNTKGYEAILREQEDAHEVLSPTEGDALTWKQNKQVRALAPWYSYLTTNDVAGEFKDIPWFRPYVVSTISFTLKKVVDGKATTARREPDTRDEVPHFDAGILALVYDKVKAQLEATHFNERKQQEQFVPNWDIDFWGLWADATAERIAQGEKYKEKVPQNDWLKITDATFLSEVSVHTPWCLAGKSTAESYLASDIVDGETYPKAVWVFFDENKNPAIGLHACEIAKNQWEIRQIRGADDNQHLGEALSEQLDAFTSGNKLKFTNSGKYREQIQDHQAITELNRHITLGTFERLPEIEQKRLLKTLYEIDRPMQSFGYGQDDRVAQLRKRRDGVKMKDAEVIFGTVATSVPDLEAQQKAGVEVKVYIGPISAALWKKRGTIEYVYTSFPDDRKILQTPSLQKTTPQRIKDALKAQGVALTSNAETMVDKIPQADLDTQGLIPTVTLRVRDLFTSEELDEMKKRGNKQPTTEGEFGIFNADRLEKLGLQLCPATVAVGLLLEEAQLPDMKTLSPGQWKSIAMGRISGGGGPYVFRVGRYGGGVLELRSAWAEPDDGWGLGHEVVFRLASST